MNVVANDSEIGCVNELTRRFRRRCGNDIFTLQGVILLLPRVVLLE